MSDQTKIDPTHLRTIAQSGSVPGMANALILAASYIESVARQEPAYSWLPMSSAPRDGTNILIRFGTDGVSQAKYVAGTPHPWKFIDTNDGITWLINHAVDTEYGPTHWMPMPSMHSAEPGIPATEKVTADALDERAAFEAWAYCNGWQNSLFKTEFGEYADESANIAFAGWQARAALAQTSDAAAEPVCDSCDGEGLIGSLACPDCYDSPQSTSSNLPFTDDQIKCLANEATTSHGRAWWTFDRRELIAFARALQSTPTASDSATASGNECRPTWHEDEGEMGEQAIRCTTCGTYKGAMCRLAGRAAS